MNRLDAIAFDADDTLWSNEPYFRDAEEHFFTLIALWEQKRTRAESILYEIELANLKRYGYGIKGFTLSMIEAALKISEGKVTPSVIAQCLALGQSMLEAPVVLLEGVEETLQMLQGRYRLVIATKGDLLDQERKLKASGLLPYFHHIEIMSGKKTDDYRKLLSHLDLPPERFLMIGNSFLSDILPVVELGAKAVHIPFSTTWQHESAPPEIMASTDFVSLGSLRELPSLLHAWESSAHAHSEIL